MGKLTTHVLDTAHGCPAAGMQIRLFDSANQLLLETTTNSDGRVNQPLLEGESMKPGHYTLEFTAGDYFKARGVQLDPIPFVDVVSIRFGIASGDAHYHVPLLVSPYAYSTYRGS
jgi:5-hydroxyisourate hydrolase